MKINEGETAVVEEKESAKEKGRSEAVLLNIVAHLEKLDRKFDSRLTEYDTKFGSFFPRPFGYHWRYSENYS